jgi:hypothetical protein
MHNPVAAIEINADRIPYRMACASGHSIGRSLSRQH